ncbi:hypothetical protein D3C71_293830 [compost metagenome]|jgi:hypothetical protein
MKFRAMSALGLAVVLAGCAEQRIVAANDRVLVVASDIDDSADLVTAKVSYFLAEPQRLDENGAGEKVTEFHYAAVFDCRSGTWGDAGQTFHFVDGQVIAHPAAQAVLERPTRDSLGASILLAVCDPTEVKAATRRPLKSIVRDY